MAGEGRAQGGVRDEFGDDPLAHGDLAEIGQWAQDPGAQHPPPHRRDRPVERRQQAAGALPAPLGLDQFEVALGGGVEAHPVVRPGLLRRVERRLVLALRRLQVAQDHAGRRPRQRQLRQRGVGERAAQRLLRAAARADRRDVAPGDNRVRGRQIAGDQHLRRVEPLQLGGGVLAVELAGLELARRDIGPGHPEPLPGGGDRGEVGRAVLAQEARVGDGAGRERADDGSLARPAPVLRLALLADRDPVAARQQPRQEGVEGVVGEAALRDGGRGPAGRAVGQLEAELARDQLGVVEEDFVEGADAEEENNTGVGVAQLEVLADQVAVLLAPRLRLRPPARHRYAPVAAGAPAASSAARPVTRSRSRTSATARATAARSPTITAARRARVSAV